MTRKDYELIADSLFQERVALNTAPHKEVRLITISNVANTLAAKLYRDNPRFDRKRFLKACGMAE